MLLALILGCARQDTFGGGTVTIDLDDRDNSGLRLVWTIDGLVADALDEAELNPEAPFDANDGAGQADGAYLRDGGGSGAFLVSARATAHHEVLGDLVEVDGVDRPECVDQIGSILFSFSVGRNFGVVAADSGVGLIDLHRSALPRQSDPDIDLEVFAQAGFEGVNQDFEVEHPSATRGAIRSGNLSWSRDVSDPCWSIWDPKVEIEWDFDPRVRAF